MFTIYTYIYIHMGTIYTYGFCWRLRLIRHTDKRSIIRFTRLLLQSNEPYIYALNMMNALNEGYEHPFYVIWNAKIVKTIHATSIKYNGYSNEPYRMDVRGTGRHTHVWSLFFVCIWSFKQASSRLLIFFYNNYEIILNERGNVSASVK